MQNKDMMREKNWPKKGEKRRGKEIRGEEMMTHKAYTVPALFGVPALP